MFGLSVCIAISPHSLLGTANMESYQDVIIIIIIASQWYHLYWIQWHHYMDWWLLNFHPLINTIWYAHIDQVVEIKWIVHVIHKQQWHKYLIQLSALSDTCVWIWLADESVWLGRDMASCLVTTHGECTRTDHI